MQLEEEEISRTVPVSLGKLNLFLTSLGLFFFAIGSYMSLGSAGILLYSGQYFFIFGIALSCLGMVSIFLKLDF